MPKIPGVNHKDAFRALKKAGFSVIREGKHAVATTGGKAFRPTSNAPALAIDKTRADR